jgi:hypothetical protein
VGSDPTRYYKQVRDWPFHVEILASSGLRLPRPERYGLAAGAGSFAAVDAGARRAVLGGPAVSGRAVAATLNALFAHVLTRDGAAIAIDAHTYARADAPAAADGGSAGGASGASVLVAGGALATAANGGPLPGLEVVGAGPHVLRPDGSVVAAQCGAEVVLAPAPASITSITGAADPQVLIEPRAGAAVVTTAAKSPLADADAARTPAAIVLCVQDTLGLPLVCRVDSAQAAERFVVGPRPGAQGSAMYAGDRYVSAREFFFFFFSFFSKFFSNFFLKILILFF